METRLSLKPGEEGTKKLVKAYGDRLVCVRYRYDRAKKKRLKTVELVVEEAPWEPAIPEETIVNVRIDYHDKELREKMKSAGAWWNAESKVWEIAYGKARKLGVRKRMVPTGKVAR